jgi:hypothetical protein
VLSSEERPGRTQCSFLHATSPFSLSRYNRKLQKFSVLVPAWSPLSSTTDQVDTMETADVLTGPSPGSKKARLHNHH